MKQLFRPLVHDFMIVKFDEIFKIKKLIPTNLEPYKFIESKSKLIFINYHLPTSFVCDIMGISKKYYSQVEF